MCLFGIFIKKNYFVILMNVFKKFTDTITEEVNQIEKNINDVFTQEPLEIIEGDQFDMDEELSNPSINSIYSELRTEFPSPTTTPNTDTILVSSDVEPNGTTPTPTPSITIEGFEDIEKKTVSEKINKELEEKFYDIFKF
jgi:hypothetical protein